MHPFHRWETELQGSDSRIRGWEGQASSVPTLPLRPLSLFCRRSLRPHLQRMPYHYHEPKRQTSAGHPASRTRTAARATTTASSRVAGSSVSLACSCMDYSPTLPDQLPLPGLYEGHGQGSGSPPSCLDLGHPWPIKAGQGVFSGPSGLKYAASSHPGSEDLLANQGFGLLWLIRC